ncbi:type I restriction endonuclease subunit R [Actinokineospora sp. 24-640]
MERPLLAQLVAMGWRELPALTPDGIPTGRSSFRDTILTEHLHAALRRVNLHDGQPWLDDVRLAQAASALLRPQATSLVEINRELTGLLITGTYVAAPEGASRDVHIDYIDWGRPENNDFVAIRQFRVVLPGSQSKAIRPDVVLFVNGIPLVVIEAKAPHTSDPVAEAIRQLRRYANQRSDQGEPEGSERLFHANQLVIATTNDEARVGTFTSGPEHFAEWKTLEPLSVEDVAAELDKPADSLSKQEVLAAGMLRPAILLDLVRHFTLFMTVNGRSIKIVGRYQQYRAVRKALRRLLIGKTRIQDGQDDRRGGIIWHTQGSGKSLTMVFLVRCMRSHSKLTAFKIVVVTDRRQLQRQLAETAALTGETVRTSVKVEQVSQYLAEPGKDLVFAMIQKYRGTDDGEEGVDRTGTGAAEAVRVMKTLGELNTDTRVLVLIDEAHRSQNSDLHASLRQALPNAALIGFTGTPIILGRKKHTTAIFGEYIDEYTIRQSEEDGATVPIMYEGRTTRSAVRDGGDLDEVFDDIFAEQTPEQQQKIKQRYGTKNAVLEAWNVIAKKARDMLRHYVDTVLPNRFKAQVVAVSREAAVRYRAAFLAARDELLAELDGLPEDLRTVDAAENVASQSGPRARLVRAYRYRSLIAALDFVPVISGKYNDEKYLAEWTDEVKQRGVIERFKESLPEPEAETVEPQVAFLIVKSMLLTGFDAPVEQVLYLDRHIKEAELLQAIARVNRTAPGKPVGYVIDYYGVTEHLKVALAAYAAEDIEGVLASVADEVPRLADRRQAVRELFLAKGVDQIVTDDDVEACVQVLADERLRAEFEARFKLMAASMEIVLPRPEALAHVGAFKVFGRVRYEARKRYREDEGFDVSIYGEKVRNLIDDHVVALGVANRVPPTSITAADFEAKVEDLRSDRAKASEMEHAIKHHIRENLEDDPVHYETLSQRLDNILRQFDGQWDQMYAAMKGLLDDVRAGRQSDDSGLDPNTQLPFLDLLRQDVERRRRALTPEIQEVLCAVTIDIVSLIGNEIRVVGFWENAHAQETLRRKVVHELDGQVVDGEDLFDFEGLAELSTRVVELARRKRVRLTGG